MTSAILTTAPAIKTGGSPLGNALAVRARGTKNSHPARDTKTGAPAGGYAGVQN